ncbi:alpha/beta fold hydrolase [Rhodanobacter sp. 7MK24]|uniref:esterase/lipase family protein n=1 Tax=Rhodanobacter sp. 7MK24 TaxID=2775922 RepID=UPI00177FEEEA|nr:alpha/beta fold hydrolase [Rhodanobacter sp. 7MK24]MBD8878923.1 alpha/beta fold hydrolase [Rhodanobacter sp. 7MK24]
MRGDPVRQWLRFAMAMVLLCLNACAMVNVSRLKPGDVVSERRNDVIGSGQLSDGTVQALNGVALTGKQCTQSFDACVGIVGHASGLDEEGRLSALSELWLGRALRADRQPVMDDATLDAYLQCARYAYAYLFYTQRTPAERVFDQRQAKVIAFYDYAVERVVGRWFQELPKLDTGWTRTDLAGWSVLRPDTDLHLRTAPTELLPASSLRFKGLRNVYRRDGFGSEFVAVTPRTADAASVPWREPRYVAMTGVLTFGGNTLDEVLGTRQVQLLVRDPYRDADASIAGRRVPLGANFTAPYGLWLARSGFAMQSIRSLLGRQGGLDSPRVLLLQPFDPNRRTVVMLHGLASSPEAWVNVANEVLGDEELRRHYQVWQVYYPTNAPIALNLMQIRRALDDTVRHFDPDGTTRATNHMMLVGHSMGGVIARLLVSSSGDKLWSLVPEGAHLSATKRAKLHQQLAPYLQFSPMPQVDAAVFLAAPHRGTPVARHRIARWIAELIRLPLGVLKEMAGVTDLLKDDSGKNAPIHVSNSVDNLSDADPFIVATANLPISPAVRYHSIVGLYKPSGSLQQSSDGVVPYASAHLDGAESEVVIPSWHSVQETPAAILELRRIMRLHLQRVNGVGTMPRKVASPD